MARLEDIVWDLDTANSDLEDLVERLKEYLPIELQEDLDIVADDISNIHFDLEQYSWDHEEDDE